MFVIAIFCFGSFRLVQAHVLQTDGSIGAILHISPADDPIAFQPQTFVLFFNDTQGLFRLKNCRCLLQLSQNNKAVYQTNLHAISDGLSQNQYTFEAAGAYNLLVVGQPLPGSSFQPFRLSYAVRVEPSKRPNNSQLANTRLRVGLVMGFIIIQAVGLLWLYRHF